MTKRHAASIALAAVVALAAGSGNAQAGSRNCSRVGTWFGVGDSGMTWIAIDTPGPDATVGQTSLEWVLLDPTLGGLFPTAARATGGQGVWEKVKHGHYKYMWMAYALDASGLPVFAARTSGFLWMRTCDHVDITYALELVSPLQNIFTDVPAFGAFTGTATETRMPLVVVQ